MPNHGDPMIVNKLIITKGGNIETEAGTSIMTVSAAGVVAQDAPAGGSEQISANTIFWAASGNPALATAGTDTAGVANRLMVTKIFIPYNTTITGIAYLIGSVGGTDKVVASLYSATGTLLANSTVSGGGTTVGTAANYQALNFTTAYDAVGPAYYWVGVNVNGTTCKVRTYPIPGAKFETGLITQTTATPGNITVPTSYTADYAPFIHTY